MNQPIETIRKTRLSLIEGVKDLRTAQLNEIPQGFNNNIIWNMGHLVAAMQGLCYRRSGQALTVPEDFFEIYKPGSRPQGPVTAEAVAMIKELLLSSLDQLQEDLEQHAGRFAVYEGFVSRYGVPLNSIEAAVQFLPFHEGLHLGYIMAQKRVLSR